MHEDTQDHNNVIRGINNRSNAMETRTPTKAKQGESTSPRAAQMIHAIRSAQGKTARNDSEERTERTKKARVREPSEEPLTSPRHESTRTAVSPARPFTLGALNSTPLSWERKGEPGTTTRAWERDVRKRPELSDLGDVAIRRFLTEVREYQLVLRSE